MTQDYYGTKRVTAWPDTQKRKVNDKLVSVEGYAVTYADGYRSWSPKDVFEAAYKPVTAMDCSGAIQAVKDGETVARASWKEKGKTWGKMGIFNPGFTGYYRTDAPVDEHGRVFQGVGLEAEDIFANDWLIVT